MATSPSNATTQEYTQGVNEIAQNDLNREVAKGTSNMEHGRVDKNTLVRWFLTTDEPWTKNLKSRRLDARSNTLALIFANGLDANIEMQTKSMNFNIDDIRRVISGLVERDSNNEAECNVCNHEIRRDGKQHLACRRCTFQLCGDCQRKMVAQYGYCECPGCRDMTFGERWYKAFCDDNKHIIPTSQMVKANTHWMQMFEETLALTRWNFVVSRGLPKKKGMVKPTPERFLPKNQEELVSLIRYLMDDIR
jgi:hypothetical protein